MSKGATIPPGVYLQPFMRLGKIETEESLIGLVARLTAEEFLGTTKLVLKGCGIDVQFPGWVANLATNDELDEIARILRVERSALQQLAWKKMADSPSGDVVSWGGRTMRLRDLESRLRLISPSTLQRQDHHRSSWMIRLLPYCPDSFEELISACHTCGRNLRWTTARGIAKCEDANCCENGRTGIGPTDNFLPQHLCAGYSRFAALLSSDDAIQNAARLGLDPDIAALTNPSLIDFVFTLARIGRPRDERMHAYFTLPDGKLKAAERIAAGMEFIEDWPKSIKAFGNEALDERANNRYKLDRLKRLPLNLKDDDLTALLRKAVPVVFMGRRTALATNDAPIMLGRDLKKLSGLNAPHIHKIVEAELLGTNVVNWGQRKQVQFDEAQALEFVKARRGSVTFAKIVDTLHLPEYAVSQLIDSGRLENVENATVELLHPEGRVYQSSLEKLGSDLKGVAVRLEETKGMISLSAASRIFGGGPKPWADIIEAILRGNVQVHLKTGSKAATARSLMISRDDMRTLGNRLGTCTSSFETPDRISKRDLEDLLNVSTDTMNELEAHDIAIFQKNGRQFSADFAASLVLAAERIFRAEAALLADVPNLRVDRIAIGLGVDELPGGGWPRAELEPFVRRRPLRY